MTRVIVGAVLVAALLSIGVVTTPAAHAASVSERDVDAVARQLRCVVCQNLSVEDSPSEMARQMRDIIRDRLVAGESPEAIKAYFVARYGEWVLLSPPTRGFGLVAWVLPLAMLGAGLVVAVVVLQRWSVRGMAREAPGVVVDEEALEAVREEMRRRGR